jgi:hypothetical protein
MGAHDGKKPHSLDFLFLTLLWVPGESLEISLNSSSLGWCDCRLAISTHVWRGAKSGKISRRCQTKKIDIQAGGPEGFHHQRQAARDPFLRDCTEEWKHQAQLVALAGNRFVLEDGQEIPDEEQATECHGEELTGMHTTEIGSLEQARIGRAGGPAIMIIHLLGLAQDEWLAAPEARPQLRVRGVDRFIPPTFK